MAAAGKEPEKVVHVRKASEEDYRKEIIRMTQEAKDLKWLRQVYTIAKYLPVNK